MVTLHRYHVVPVLPAEIAALSILGKNLYWTWNRAVRELFARIDPELYERVAENPLALLARVAPARLEELARDPGFAAAVEEQRRGLTQYLEGPSWYRRTYGDAAMETRIGYFSMEFGIHECLPVYSGGLGVLAGDHLKSASDLGLPLVGVGIAFSLGYFRQTLDEEGWQTERYPPNDWHDLTVSAVTDAAGAPALVSVSLPVAGDKAAAGARSRDVHLRAWRVDVGRVPLYLLDADHDKNAPEDRALTNTLYGGDRTHRIRQEILLGVGGIRMLELLGLRPAVCHMNEGHSAFLAIERVRQLMAEEHVPFEVATEAAAAGNVFTTHTPVPAGNDAFAHDLIAPYVELLAHGLGKTGDDVMRIGRVLPDTPGGEFSMPVLAIRMADRYNGVSVLHGREARAMWSVLWPGLGADEVPIGAVTNGVHLGTWVAKELAELYGMHLGPGWLDDGCDPEVWGRIERVPDAEIWGVHERCRERLIGEVRRRLRSQAERKGRAWEAAGVEGLLDPRALTIGFARRFATYKRGTLLLRDAQRLERIVSAEGRPVQLLFAGKAHPQDWGGKELIQGIVRASRAAQYRGKIVFVEDYDMGVARALVSGVDVWLNTPRRPLEASGTSGMKAALNGALHASVLDGWWCEAFAGNGGFAIGHGEEYADAEYGDRVEAEALYRLLEEQIVPEFYDRDREGLPRRWIARMKRSIAGIGPVFNTARMVREYAEKAYAPAGRRFRALAGEGLARARELAAWKARVATAWPAVRIESVVERGTVQLTPGRELGVVADVELGTLAPSDVAVEVYYGPLEGGHRVTKGRSAPMSAVSQVGESRWRFEGSVPTGTCGEHAFAVRVVPHHDGLAERFGTRLLSWH